jgi:AraC-like DNA-binding protein
LSEAYARVFGCPVSFSKGETRLFFRKDFLTTLVMSHDKSLYALFRQILHERESVLSDSISFVEKVRRTVIGDFKGQVPSMEVIASYHNLSSRSFQRKLANENTSYRKLTNEIKKELTLMLLKSPHHSTSEIAKVLGYTEAGAFHTAFKSWTNETPATWRARNNVESFE